MIVLFQTHLHKKIRITPNHEIDNFKFQIAQYLHSWNFLHLKKKKQKVEKLTFFNDTLNTWLVCVNINILIG